MEKKLYFWGHYNFSIYKHFVLSVYTTINILVSLTNWVAIILFPKI